MPVQPLIHRACVAFVLSAVFLAMPGVSRAQASSENVTGDRHLPHLRFGFELGGGVGYGASTGATLGLYGHIGYQANKRFAIFYQGGFVGYGITREDEVNAFRISTHTAMFDLTAGDVAQLGFGGGFDIGDFAHCPEESPCTYDGRGVSPSLDLRVGFLLRARNAKARWYVPFSLHAHIAFSGDETLNRQNRQTMLLLTLGIERAGMRLRR